MRLSKDLLDKAVVTIDDGRIVGHVKDLYLSADLSALAGIHLGKEGLLRRKSLLIPAESVVVFGIDVVLVRSADALTDDKQLKDSADWVRLDKVQGREVDTPGGTKVGVIGDIVLDEAGEVTAYALSRVYVEGPISEKRIVYRNAVIDNGNEDGIMTIDIAQAEGSKQSAPIVVSTPMADEEAPTDEELDDSADKAQSDAS